MTLPVEEHPEARAEYLHAVSYYEGLRAGLGAELIDRFEDAIEDIRDDPQTWPVYPDWQGEPVLRSRSVKTFRYRIVYYVRDETVRVIAYAHTSREPGYWHARTRT
ncbi:MAG: type II toxin-antitoxin system RelE/ParE family toxin [Candidatus Phosphoribacter sp.]